jgi:hypothetical protein
VEAGQQGQTVAILVILLTAEVLVVVVTVKVHPNRGLLVGVELQDKVMLAVPVMVAQTTSVVVAAAAREEPGQATLPEEQVQLTA